MIVCQLEMLCYAELWREKIIMEGFVTKQEEKLFRALQTLLGNCVDSVGLPKRPTAKQLKKADETLTKYEHYANEILRAKVSA